MVKSTMYQVEVNIYENSSLSTNASLMFVYDEDMCALKTGNICRERNLRFNREFDQRRGSWPRLPSSVEYEYLVISPGSCQTVLGYLSCVYCLKAFALLD